jgi:hypothetical protein
MLEDSDFYEDDDWLNKIIFKYVKNIYQFILFYQIHLIQKNKFDFRKMYFFNNNSK